ILLKPAVGLRRHVAGVIVFDGLLQHAFNGAGFQVRPHEGDGVDVLYMVGTQQGDDFKNGAQACLLPRPGVFGALLGQQHARGEADHQQYREGEAQTAFQQRDHLTLCLAACHSNMQGHYSKFLRAASKSTRTAKRGKASMRRARDGCLTSRYNHSSPAACTHRGARRTRPANTSKLPPTPIFKGTPHCCRLRAIHRSWRGAPIATSRICGAAARTAATTRGSSSGPKYPWWVPATMSPGNRAARRRAASSATPSAAPRKYTR